jgi:hypothetical protein
MYGAITLYGGPFQVPSTNPLFGNFTLDLQFEKPETKLVFANYSRPWTSFTDVRLSYNPLFTTPVGFNIKRV